MGHERIQDAFRGTEDILLLAVIPPLVKIDLLANYLYLCGV